MSEQIASQQMIGFAIGANATAPEYVVPARVYSANLEPIYNEVRATLGNRDRLVKKDLVGYSSSQITLTINIDDKVFPVLAAAGMTVASSVETTGAFTNTLVPRNTDGAGDLTIKGEALTFFFYRGAAGLFKKQSCYVTAINSTVETEAVNAEFTVMGADESLLTGADLTTAEAGFTIGANIIQNIYNFGDVKFEYADSTAFVAGLTAFPANSGMSLNIDNMGQEVMRTYAPANGVVYPNIYYGGFAAGFEVEGIIENGDMYAIFQNNEKKAVRCNMIQVRAANIGASTLKPRTTFIYSPSPLMVSTSDFDATSDDPVAYNVSLDTSVNAPSGTESFKLEIVCDKDLSALF